MATAAILGCAGYTGQETLDRLLAHPELEPVALGSDSLAGQRASSLDPRLNGDLPPFVTNAEALAAGADVVFLCLGHEAAAAIEPPRRRARRRPLRRAPPARRRRSTRSGTASSIRGPARGATGCRSSSRPSRRSSRTPAATRPPRCSRSRRSSDAIDPSSVVVDAKSGVSGAGRGLKPSSHAGFVLENLTPYRVGTHQHAPEIEQALGFPVCFVPHLLPVRRGLLVTCYVQPRADAARAARGRVRGLARRFACSTRASRPTSRACSTPTPPRSRSTTIARRAATIVVVRARQPRQGRGRQRRAERQRRARLRRDGRAAAERECWYERHGRQGLHGVAASPRASASSGPDLALVAGHGECVGAAMFTANRVQAAPVIVSKEHLEHAQPQRGRRQLGECERRDGRAGYRRRARDCGKSSAPPRTRARGGARPLDRRDRRAAAGRAAARRARRGRRGALGRRAAPTQRRRSSRPTRARRKPPRTATASPSAAWRRARE